MDNFFASYPNGSGGSMAGVSSVNGLTGALTLAAGSGISITPSGNTLTIASTGGSGANTALSNLIATDINQSFTFNTGADAFITTLADSTRGLSLTSGPKSIGNSGPVLLASGEIPSGAGNSGDLSIHSGDQSSGQPGNTGALAIKSGDASSGASGNVFIQSGTSNGDVSGDMLFASGAVVGNAASGSLTLVSGATDTNLSGAVSLKSGAGEAGSGIATLGSGTSNGGNTGDVFMLSGGAAAGTSGNISLLSGTSASGNDTGSISIATSPGDAGQSGPISLTTGAVIGNAASGSLSLISGDADTNNSGSIILRTGTSPATRGSITFVDGSEGTAGQVWTSTDTGGKGAWAPVSASAAGSSGAVQFNNAGSFGADTANFFWDNANQRLGIRNPAPGLGVVLGVGPDLALSNLTADDTRVVISSSSSASGHNSGLIVGQDDTHNLNFTWVTNPTPTSAVANLVTFGYTNRLDIDALALCLQANSGLNVGIGMNTPDLRLQISNPGPSGFLVRVGDTSGLYMDFSNGQVAAFNGGASSDLFLNYSSQGNVNLVGQGGFVGIGTIAPTAQLHATGTVRFENYGVGYATFDASGNITSTNILPFTSAAGAGGAASEVMTVTGLLSTDTVLSVSQMTAGANSLPILGWTTVANDALTVQWSADPGAGAVIVITVKR